MKTLHINLILISLLTLILFCRPSFSHAVERQTTLPITTDDIQKFNELPIAIGEEFYSKQFLEGAQQFTEKELNTLKQSRFIPEVFTQNITESEHRYNLIAEFKEGDYTYKVILYYNYLESDTVGSVTALIAYNSKNEAIDSIILDFRYRYEDYESYSEFVIHRSGLIETQEFVRWRAIYEGEGANYTDEGCEYPYTIDPPIQCLSKHFTYQIQSDGHFRLIEKADYLWDFHNTSYGYWNCHKVQEYQCEKNPILIREVD